MHMYINSLFKLFKSKINNLSEIGIFKCFSIFSNLCQPFEYLFEIFTVT